MNEKDAKKETDRIDGEIHRLNMERNVILASVEQEEKKRRNTKVFKVTKNHIKLLKNMYVGWDDCEFGAPEVDPKRPYGNSDVLSDIAVILGMTTEKKIQDDDEGIDNILSEKEHDRLCDLHKEMQIVLQICVVNNGVKVGKYKRDEYSNNWKLVK